MPRARSPNRDKAFEIYKKHKGSIQLREIAKILDTPEKTISGWKVKDKWDNKLSGVLQSKIRSTPNKKKNTKKKDKEPVAEEVKEVLENTELTDKQRLFCIYYIKCFNATKAYQKAYVCDYKTANTNGPRLLVNVRVRKEIEKLKEGKLNRAMLSEEDIFQKYIDIAFTDINDFMEFGQKEIPELNENGEQKLDLEGNPMTYTIDYAHFKSSSEVDGTLISEVSKGKDGAKIKLQDKMKALQWLSDRMDLLPTETKIKIDNEKAKVQMAREKLDFEKAKAGGNSGTNDGVLKEMLEGLKDGI